MGDHLHVGLVYQLKIISGEGGGSVEKVNEDES
jgi:hypothetical protein